MRTAHLPAIASVGIALLTTWGCYSPYPAPYGSPYGYPSAPVQTLTPGGTYVPSYPQGTISPSPTPASPSTSPNSTFSPGGANTDAPFYTPSNNSSTVPYSGGSGTGVPRPRDPGEVNLQPTRPRPVAEDVNLFEQGQLEGAAATASVAKLPVDNAEFLEPVPVDASNCPPSSAVGIVTVPGAPSPFAHDAAGYRWLRGVARLNDATGTWSLIYSTVDPASDRYQGWLTLASDPKLSQLQPNRAYLVKGQLDPSQTDAAGKPVYRVQSIEPWNPTPTL